MDLDILLKRTEKYLQSKYKQRLAELEDQYKDTNPLPLDVINEIGQLKDKIKGD